MIKPCCKKLIEVALPLPRINAESAHEKSILPGRPDMKQVTREANAHSDFMSFRQQIRFDFISDLCYKFITSPLFLRVQGARRSCTASAFLTISQSNIAPCFWWMS